MSSDVLQAGPGEGDKGPPAGPHAPLSPGDAALVKEAGVRARRIRRVAGIAGVNGWTAAVFGVCALLAAPLSTPMAPVLVVGLGLTLGAFIELRGRRLLLAMDERAPRLLALNQIVIAGAVTVYCAWNIVGTLREPSGSSDPELQQLLAAQPDLAESLVGMARGISLAVYGLVIILTAVIEGLLALYYLSRRRLLAEHRRLTPPWIAEIQRRLAA